jgi:nitrile hydratase
MLAPGTAVTVKLDWPETRGPCHIRTPHFIRGAQGVVERHLGRFPNPEDLAFARPAAMLDLYHVRFDQPAIWGEGKPGDAVVIELTEAWLEPA